MCVEVGVIIHIQARQVRLHATVAPLESIQAVVVQAAHNVQQDDINTTEQSSEALTAVFPNPNPKAWLNGLRFGCITRKLGMPPKMSAWRFGRNSSFLFSPHPTPARRAQEWRHVVPA